MKARKILRLIALVFMIGLACVLPVPMSFTKKDEAPKYLIEQIDKHEDDTQDTETKELF